MNKPKTKKLFNKKLKTKKRNKRSIKTFDYTQKAGTLTTNNVYEDSKFFSCPITQDIFIEPVIASDGLTYEKYAIEKVMSSSALSPLTRQPLHSFVYPNLIVKDIIDELRNTNEEFRNQYNDHMKTINHYSPSQMKH